MPDPNPARQGRAIWPGTRVPDSDCLYSPIVTTPHAGTIVSGLLIVIGVA